MRPRDQAFGAQLEARLVDYSQNHRNLPGIAAAASRRALIEQLIESARRVSYVSAVARREIDPRRADPSSDLFDPLRAAILQQRSGNTDEAHWLVFLFVHFGKHAKAGWHYARMVYGRLGTGRWDWPAVSSDPAAFSEWLQSHVADLKPAGSPHGFGNHRKYESLKATAETVESYVHWVNPPRTHDQLFSEHLAAAGDDGKRAFNSLYRSMNVSRFGRTARFDYLAMVGKLGLSAIEPDLAYLAGATGPLTGTRLLFGTTDGARSLDGPLADLGSFLDLNMQIVEDAICNWQKSPSHFVAFRG